MGKRHHKDRVDVSGASAGGLNDAFSALSNLGLPAEPQPVPPQPPQPEQTLARGRVLLRRETAHRGGKTVVVVSDFDPAISSEAIERWARAVRKACGCGGTVRGREIEIQGDQPAQVAAYFKAQGFRVAGVVA